MFATKSINQSINQSMKTHRPIYSATMSQANQSPLLKLPRTVFNFLSILFVMHWKKRKVRFLSQIMLSQNSFLNCSIM